MIGDNFTFAEKLMRALAWFILPIVIGWVFFGSLHRKPAELEPIEVDIPAIDTEICQFYLDIKREITLRLDALSIISCAKLGPAPCSDPELKKWRRI